MVLGTCKAIVSISTTHGNSDVWIADTGTSCHCHAGVFNIKTINNGNLIKAMKMRCKCASVLQPGGITKKLLSPNAKYKAYGKSNASGFHGN
jgi:hypothetical protein